MLSMTEEVAAINWRKESSSNSLLLPQISKIFSHLNHSSSLKLFYSVMLCFKIFFITERIYALDVSHFNRLWLLSRSSKHRSGTQVCLYFFPFFLSIFRFLILQISDIVQLVKRSTVPSPAREWNRNFAENSSESRIYTVVDATGGLWEHFSYMI